MCCFIQINISILNMWFIRLTKGAFHLIGFHKYSYSMVWKYRDWRRSLPFDSSFFVSEGLFASINKYITLRGSKCLKSQSLFVLLFFFLFGHYVACPMIYGFWLPNLKILLVGGVFIKYFNISLRDRHINYTTVI
jgi:hypothetical protein